MNADKATRQTLLCGGGGEEQRDAILVFLAIRGDLDADSAGVKCVSNRGIWRLEVGFPSKRQLKSRRSPIPQAPLVGDFGGLLSTGSAQAPALPVPVPMLRLRRLRQPFRDRSLGNSLSRRVLFVDTLLFGASRGDVKYGRTPALAPFSGRTQILLSYFRISNFYQIECETSRVFWY
jgi:hypothetical protein